MSRVSVSNRDGSAVITVRNDFVFDLNREFRSAYQSIAPRTPVTVDLSQTTYMDSAGLGMLIQLREFAGGDNASVKLIGVNETISTILTVANFSRLFSISS